MDPIRSHTVRGWQIGDTPGVHQGTKPTEQTLMTTNLPEIQQSNIPHGHICDISVLQTLLLTPLVANNSKMY